MPNSIKEFTAREWNEKMSGSKLLIKQLHQGIVRILCNRCGEQLQMQGHFDFDDLPHKQQYICTGCQEPEYIIV